MKNKYYKILLAAAVVYSLFFWNCVTAQESVIVIENKDVFGELKRPAVDFPHDLHMESLMDEGCGACHHVMDTATGKIVYEEGMESYCKDCHGKNRQGKISALREAYHESCTGCHRNMIAEKSIKSGPTTCGECHIKK